MWFHIGSCNSLKIASYILSFRSPSRYIFQWFIECDTMAWVYPLPPGLFNAMGQIWGTEYLILIFSYYVYVSYSYQFRYFWKDSPDTLYKFIVIVYCDVYLFCKFACFQIDEFAESTVNSSFSLYMYTVYCIMYMFTVHFTERGLKLLQILSTIVSKITRDLPV